MANKKQVWGILAVVLVFGLILAGCPTDGAEPYSGPKSITITDFDVEIPETTNNKTGVKGKYLYMHVREGETNDSNELAFGQVINPSGQDITFELSNSGQPWRGTGSYYIWIEGPPKNDSTKGGGKYFYSVNGTDAAPVDINSAVTTLKWSDFVWFADYMAG
jgi:hypothetical protein